MNFSLRRVAFSELTLWLVVGALGLFYILPLKDRLRYGIDLVGGTYLTLEVHTEKAVETELVERMEGLDEQLKKAGSGSPVSKVVKDNAIVLTFQSLQDVQSAAVALKDILKNMTQEVAGTVITLRLPDREIQRIKEDAVNRNVEVLRTRMRSEVTEISIVPQGERNIVVELPKVANVQEEKAKIVQAAHLDFRLVELTGRSKEDILAEYGDDLPEDKEILSGTQDGEFYLVSKYSDITGKLLKEARPSLGGATGVQPVVAFKFSDEGGERFYKLTSKNYGKPLAIVLDNKVISAPRINDPIRESGQITGNFTTKEVKELSLLLQSGSYVAPVTFEEERQIGPTLGADSIRSGLLSCLVSLVLLFFFSIFCYNVSGLFAFIALVYNLLLILIGMAWLGAALTLPGIAGMVLTVGMAIDASILIYERVREEVSKGETFKRAIDIGFNGAMRVILDANITTFIVGAVLYYFGTGPVKGFAVTMMLGIIATLIAGLRFLRSIFSFIFANFNVQKIKI